MSSTAKRSPNLFIVGAMKSATTSLHNYLDLHPDIFMTKDPWKEPAFFVKELNWDKGLEWYEELFSCAEYKCYYGESSTDYSKLPHYQGVIERIHTYCPEARIIYVMRDPIERAISQYWWEVEFSGEGRSMKTGILENPWILNISDYPRQIKPYLQTFGPEQVYVLTYEELVDNPKLALNKVFAWLGLSTDIDLPEDLPVHNKSSVTVNRVVGAGLLSYFKGTWLWNLAKQVIGKDARARLLKSLAKPTIRDDSQRDDTIQALRPIMLPQVQELSDLLKRDFTEWKTLFDSV